MSARPKQDAPVKQAGHIQARIDRIAAGTEKASPVGTITRGLRFHRRKYDRYRRRYR